ncbi:type I polyketide synthase [Streptomyces alfalfae]|uniref:SDR family oxidoreductase n=1 Tax=Streptomyces alfalfae TaxID=1642299 RepID=A0A7T4PLP5_9ACTN|nr:type I polyketide synthase [Streptomyces alfalfae]QQC92398.1 SDR family oxidoreductase [Streptomyces alfalfae]
MPPTVPFDQAPPGAKPLSIAVIGLGSLLPGSENVEEFWRDVLNKRDRMTAIPESHWLIDDYFDPDPSVADKTYARRGAFLSPVAYDPLAFGTPPATLEATDTTQLLSLFVAERALRDAFGDTFTESARERTGVVVGTGALELLTHMSSRLQRPVWLKALRECGISEENVQRVCDRIAGHYVPWQEATFPGLLSNVVAGRIANRFDLHGINHTTDAACASSLAALSVAVDQLVLGRADIMLAGGVDTLNDPTMYLCFSKTPALSPSGDCRPFSADADGTMLGEGLVMFVLKRLQDAERDHDRVYAVLRGMGASSDGRGSAIYAPTATGQARALRRAYQMAGYSPDTVELVEAHGTGTKAGDAAEFEALRRVFAESGRAGEQWCALGSVKSQIGHTKSAAGAAGLLKVVLALHHKILPPTIKVSRPNPDLDLASSPLYLNTEARPWVRAPDHPRRASVSSFGFGGSNFHLTLEEYRPASAAGAGFRSTTRRDTADHAAGRLRNAPSELIVVGGADVQECLDQARSLREKRTSLGDAARASQLRFASTATTRLALVCADLADMEEKIRQAATVAGVGTTPVSVPGGAVCLDTQPAPAGADGSIAYVFAGQGVQYPGMGADLAMFHPDALDAWNQAIRLREAVEVDVHQVAFPPAVFSDEDRRAQNALLTDTRWAQPALAVTCLAQLRLLDRLGVTPSSTIGHSFGELVALHAAGVYSEADLVRLATARGTLVADAARTQGAMLALVGPAEDVDDLLKRLDGERIWAANFNSPTQTVLSGTTESVARAEQEAHRAGFSTHRLQASAAFHSPLIAPAVEPFTACLDNTRMVAPRLPVYANEDGGVYPTDPERIRRRLAQHLTSPVRFARGIESMYEAGARTFIEVGAGSALSGLIGQILADRPHLTVNLDQRGHNGVTAFHEALGRLAVAGVPLDFGALWAPFTPSLLNPPRSRSKMTTEISGTNHQRPYPPSGGTQPPPDPNRNGAPPFGGESVARPAPARTPSQPYPAPEAVTSDRAATLPAEQTVSQVTPTAVTRSTPMRHWLSAFEQVQRANGEVHCAYTRAMAESHMAFMRTAEASLNGLASVLGQTAAYPTTADDGPARVSAPGREPAPKMPRAPAAPAEPAAEPVRRTSAEVMPPAPDLPPTSDLTPAPDLAPAPNPATAPTHMSVPAPPPARTPTSAQAPAPVQATPAPTGSEPTTGFADPAVRHIEEMLLEIVSEQTRYPRDLLDATMDLEADLGIDSIKRVQMLARIRSDIPDLPDIEATELAQLRTLGAIAARFVAARESRGRATATSSGDSDDSEGEPGSPLDRIVHHRVKSPAPGFRLPGLYGRTLQITDDGGGVAAALVDVLIARGQSACVVDDISPPADAVLHLGGLRDVTGTESALAVLRDVFATARRVAAHVVSGDVVFVVVQDTGGDFAEEAAGDQPVLGGLAALARTADVEWPDAVVKAIDCARHPGDPMITARRLADELLRGGDERDVGLRQDGTRLLLRTTLAPLTEPSATPPLAVGAESVLLVSGGGRGVTAECARALAAAHRPHLALIGRTPLAQESEVLRAARGEDAVQRTLIQEARAQGGGTKPSPAIIRARVHAVLAAREIRATLHDLVQTGAKARYYCADVSDPEALRHVVDDVHDVWGPVTGIIHGAGVIADKVIAEKTDEQFAHVLDTKVNGLLALLGAVEGDPIDLLCLFSSVSAWHGNAGQCDYAMANEAVEHLAVAHAAQWPRCRVKAIAWGPWRGGMVTADLAEHFGRQGVALIPEPAGAQAFVRELHNPDGVRVLISPAAPHPGRSSTRAHRVRAADLVLCRDSHAYLRDHSIRGTPVVPLALGAEWIMRLTNSHRLTGLQVLRRIALEGDKNDRLLVELRVHDAPDGSRVARLGPRGPAPYYTAVIPTAPHRVNPFPSDSAADSLGVTLGDPYAARALFQGPAFRLIHHACLWGHDGAQSVVHGLHDSTWPLEPWHTDAAAVDAGVQTATLWAEHALGRVTVPMGVEDYLLHAAGPAPGPVRCVIRPVAVRDTDLSCDITLCDEDGPPRAHLRGVTLVTVPT